MTSSASTSSSPTGPCRLSLFVEASFCMRPFSSCTTTVASDPTSSDTFPTPSAVDDDFYTHSLASFGSCSIIDIHVVGLAALRSTSSAPVAAIAGVGDTIGLNVACHRLTIRSLLQLSQQQLGRFSSSVHIPLYIVSTPPKKGPQHCGPEVREEREAHLHYNGFLIFSFGDYFARYRPSLLE
ncbi:hypothetical protein BHM03_00042475 [Ensete ventricosum]|uniref:Uncharacterized protein n=1 Tax=Ensete ventricosum TaxID=4639 RepID=A0A445MKV0_ENSVE|nr:hypothetical protein BHM03_00042475 [Ensete ventricosum]